MEADSGVNGQDARIWWGVAGVSAIAIAGALVAADLVISLKIVLGLLGAGGVALAGFRLFGADRATVKSDPTLARYLADETVGRAIISAEGTVVAANAAYRAIVGAGDETPPDPSVLVAGDEEAAGALQAAEAAARAGRVMRVEQRITGPGGRVRWLALTAEPIPGGADRFLWRIEDLSDLRAPIEAAMRRGEELAHLVDWSPFGLFVAESDGRITEANAAFARLVGRPRETLIGRLKLVECLSPSSPPDGAASGTFSAEARTPNGGILPVSVTMGRSARTDGRIRIQGTIRLVDQELELRDSLKRAEEQFRHFFDYAPIGIVVLDQEDRVIETNVAFGSIAADGGGTAGRSLLDFVREEDRLEVRDRLAQTRRGGAGDAPIEVRLTGRSERVAQLFVSRLGPTPNGAVGLLVHVIDTTEQKSLEIQFAQSQKMQAVGQLAGGIAHDFNNLLTAMIGFCDLLLLRHQAGDQSFADIMQIKQNANRAANLVRQLLAFSRQQTLRPKVINITDVLAELSHLLRRLIGAQIQLQMTHGRDLGLVKVDQGQLEQVIINLVVNARDAMPDGGTLTVRTANVTAEESTALGHELMPAGEYVLVEVIDTGVGIPKENLGKIFEPFFTTKPTGAGTGLGLSTVYGIVKQTGGFIFPFSQMTKGTTFKIYLPRYKPASGEEPVTAEAMEKKDARDLTGKGTILLVEDEDAVRVFAARALRNKGYTVVEANSGETALTEIERLDGRIDVLVTDVVMPGVDGPTLAKRVRESRPDMKIIFISGYAEDAFRRNLDRSTEIHFLPKPFSLKQLAGKVKEVLTSETV